MDLTSLDFHLPSELIAQDPVEPRDGARLLVYTRSDQSITHHHVRDLPNLLPASTTIVVNRSRVRKGRLQATRAKGRAVEVLVLEPTGEGLFECMIGGKGVQPDEIFTLSNGHVITVVAPHTEASFTSFILNFHLSTSEAEQLIAILGTTPLPPYITHSHAPDERYQTVFAQELGSAAAPTAGLHFTPELITKLKQQFAWEEVVLHVGMGTFQPLRQERIEDNELHHEETFIEPTAAEHLQAARVAHHPILAVGTTSCRTLESHVNNGHITPGNLTTNLFIYPGFHFQATDLLFTNFHLPKSSLLLLVAARLDTNPANAIAELQRIYAVAIAQQYRFFSFGDAMLIR